MSAPEYQIGCTVFWGSFESSENHVECPDCGGTGRLRVILHDETQVSIECDTCKLGYHGPSGRIRIYDRKPIVRSGEISGVETRREGGFEYRITHFALGDDGRMYQGSYTVNDDRVFTNEDEAMKIAMATAEEDKNERDRILRKEKNTRSWAWNVRYHRRCIKGAEKQIEYHTSKLNVASLKVKQDKKEETA